MVHFTVLLAVLLGLAAATPAGAAERRVPPGWLGVTVDGHVSPYAPGEWNRMAGAGVETVRTAIRWFELQPYAPGEVPPAEASRFQDVGGIPTTFELTDAVVSAAARRHLTVLPVVQQAPSWVTVTPNDLSSPPRDPARVDAFFVALVNRYGPDGSLWREHPELPREPIRTWQIWNEPNLTGFWSEQPFGESYVRTLRAAAGAVRRTDPGARILLAGLPNKSWLALRQIYDAGGRGLFDAVALHPYTARVRDVLRLVRLSRREMRARGDGALPVWITELSWPAARGKVAHPDGFETTDAGQAVLLGIALRRLAAARTRLGIAGVVWYTWLSSERGPSAFDWSGLRRIRGNRNVATPALRMFRRVAKKLNGCRKVPGDAQRCA